MRALLEFPFAPLELDIAEPFLLEINAELETGTLSMEQAFDLLSQVAFFEDNQEAIAREYRGSMVAVVRRQVVRVPNPSAALRLAEAEFGGGASYVVSIPRDGRVLPLLDADATPQRYVYEEEDGRIRISRQ